MSVRVEWMGDPAVEFAPKGTELPDGQVTDYDAVVISADSVVVIEGDLEQFLAAVEAAVARAR